LYGTPQYKNEIGFSLIIFRVPNEARDYVIECLKVLGCDRINRECGVTTTFLFDSPEESNAMKAKFVVLLEEAQEKGLSALNGLNPQEYYMLQTHAVIIDVCNTNSKHFIVLQAEIDAFHRIIWSEMGCGSIIEKEDDDDRV
jgi:hypothetical protein